MAIKSCRHASQALKLPEFRRALRHHDTLGCELCAKPPARGNSRSKPVRRRSPTSPGTPDSLGESSSSTSSHSNNAVMVQTLKGWAPNPAWEDLYLCISCGFMACLGKSHFMLHFQVHPKHCVGFHVASRTFWCCPCKHEVDASKGKLQDSLRECDAVFEEIARKQQRRVRDRLVVNPTLSPEDDEIPDSQRSYVADDDSSRRGGGITEELMKADSISSPDTDTSMRTNSPDPTNEEPMDQDALPNPIVPVVVSKPASRQQPPQPPAEAPVAPAVLGFSNLGNTCYFNAATQALLTVLQCYPSLVDHEELINRMATNPIAATLMMLNQTIIKKTRNLPVVNINLSDIRKSKGKPPPRPVLTVAPLLKEMRKKFAQFRGSYQQDAHELFTSLLWAIDEEIDPPKPQPPKEDDAKDENRPDQLVNVFVKTDTGETVSLRVAPNASVEEIQAMLVKKLALNEDDVFLQPTSTPRATMTRRSMQGSDAQVFSKLNFVRALFNASLTTEVRCLSCGNCSETVEDAFQLSLPIPAMVNGRTVSMKDCLDGFTATTALQVEAQNGYECEKCSLPSPKSKQPPVLRDASMRQRISDLPRMLVLHLKRLGRLRKITQHIQFDAMLEMAPHVDDDVLERYPSTLYELVAVIVHKGNKRAGHYVAYVSRNRVQQCDDIDDTDFSQTTRSTLWKLEDPDHDWFYISDSLVQSVPFDQVLKCEAYMLFYQQVAPSEPTSPRLTTTPSFLRPTTGRQTDADCEIDSQGSDVGTDRESGDWI